MPARRALPGAAAQAAARLQHQLPHHQQAHRADVQAQARRLHHTVHGGHRQGTVDTVYNDYRNLHTVTYLQEISDMKLTLNARARIVSEEFLKQFN